MADSHKAHLSFLIELAYIDGKIVEEEEDIIFRVGRANGIEDDEIHRAIKNPISHTTSLKNLDPDEKFEYLYNIVQLMKVDGRLYKEEIKFCSHMAGRLGYDESVLFELITKIQRHEIDADDKAKLKERVQTYLR